MLQFVLQFVLQCVAKCVAFAAPPGQQQVCCRVCCRECCRECCSCYFATSPSRYSETINRPDRECVAECLQSVLKRVLPSAL